MDNIKGDKYYLKKIIEHIDFILKKTDGLSLNQVKNNDLLIDSIMFRLIQIAEEAQELSSSFKDKTASLPWHQLYGIRNRIVHAYEIIRIDIVYETITKDLKPFRDSLMKYL